eukprot:284211-Rhodomonas_salina.2
MGLLLPSFNGRTTLPRHPRSPPPPRLPLASASSPDIANCVRAMTRTSKLEPRLFSPAAGAAPQRPRARTLGGSEAHDSVRHHSQETADVVHGVLKLCVPEFDFAKPSVGEVVALDASDAAAMEVGETTGMFTLEPPRTARECGPGTSASKQAGECQMHTLSHVQRPSRCTVRPLSTAAASLTFTLHRADTCPRGQPEAQTRAGERTQGREDARARGLWCRPSPYSRSRTPPDLRSRERPLARPPAPEPASVSCASLRLERCEVASMHRRHLLTLGPSPHRSLQPA